MPQYYLDRYFVPDDKDIFDMLKACGTSQEKLWMFARGYGILFSSTEPREMLIDSLSRLPMDRRKMQELFLLNSSKDRDEKYSTKSVASNATLERITAVVNSVRDTRATSEREEYKFEQPAPGIINVKVGYREPDFSRAEAIQTREKELTIQIIPGADGKLKIRHHSNEKAEAVVKDIMAKLESATGSKAPITKLDFSGIKDPKVRTRFFQDLSLKLSGHVRQDVASVKVYRLNKSDESQEEEEEKVVVAEVRRMFMSGVDVTQCQEYLDLEKRGFFISAITWTTEHQAGDRENYEFSAEFTNPETPLDIKYGCLGKYARNDEGELKKNRVVLSAIERDALLGLLDSTAFTIYDTIVGELNKTTVSNGNPSAMVS